MNVYVLKGVLLDANPPGAGSALKERVFDAISFPGFINSTYDVIGVEFGLGIMEIAATPTTEQAVVKIQIWNLNEGKNFILNWRHFLKGSRFAIITWNHAPGDDLAHLDSFIKDCREKCPDINLGIVVLTPEGSDWIDRLPAMIEAKHGLHADKARDMEDMVTRLVSQCLDNGHVAYVLPVKQIEDIRRVACIQNPFFNYMARASDNLVCLLEQLKITIDKSKYVAMIDNEDYFFQINLNNSTLHVASKHCIGCNEFPCRECFAKICVVLDSQIKKGFASNDLGLSTSDLFVLSMVFALTNDRLPTSITSQFPKTKPCSRRK
nr:hypothetical protein [Candidatus Sigynarchaeota archaeon]